MAFRPIGQGPAVDGGIGNIIGLGVLGVAGWAFFSLFWVSLALGFAALGFTAFCIWMLTRLDPLPQPRKGIAAAALVLAILAVFLVYPLSFDNHIIAFPIAGWTIAGLFVASLIAGAWNVVPFLMKIIATVLAVSLATYLVVFPTPGGAADPNDKESEWKIELKVLDEKGEAMKGALAQCNAVMFWNKDEMLSFDFPFQKATDDDGVAKFTFHEDTRLKVAVCGALKEKDWPATWRAPSDEEIAEATYPVKSTSMASPLPGGDYKLTLKLEPRHIPPP